MKNNRELLIILLLFFWVSLSSNAQKGPGKFDEPAWVSMMQDRNANYFDVQKSFRDYWKQYKWEKGYGYKVFKRWEWYTENRVDSNGFQRAPRYVFNEYLKHKGEKSLNGNWHALGPIDLPDNWTGGPNGMGRVNALAFHPTDPLTIYAGAPSGGLWVTYDGGMSWVCKTDQLPTLGVSAVLVDYENPEVIYIGTGDRDAGDAPGMGVMKTVNGGFTWDFIDNGMGYVTVSKMTMHPSDHNIILAATSGGVFKTFNGGENWHLVTGVANFKDISYKPGDPSVIYASSSTFYRSTDGGENFHYVLSGLTSSYKKLIGVSPANPEVVYVLSSNTYSFKACYKSADEGQTFTLQSDTPNIFGYDKAGGDSNGQAWYDLCVTVDPLDAATIYTGGINIWVSHDSGVSWQFNVGGSLSDSTYIHVDQHFLAFSPVDQNLYVGNDGGIFMTSDHGHQWNNKSQGLSVAQIYRIGQSPVYRDLVINGNQDNGSTVYDNGNWRTVLGADGMECQFDPADTSVQYGSYYYGSIQRSMDGGTHFHWIGGKGYGNITEQGAWVSPYQLHVSDPNTMFLGLENLWRTNDVKNPDHDHIAWTKITSSISNTDSVYIRVIAQSPANTNVLYFSREDNKLYRSDDVNSANPDWTNISSYLPAGVWPYDIKCHPTSQNIVYIICSNRVYRSVDKGLSWTNINGTLPAVAENSLVCEPGNTGGIYLGTDAGVFYRNNSMADWIAFNNGFPPAAKVTEMEIFYDASTPSNSRLRASTYGRGLWESDLYSNQNNPPVANFSADLSLHEAGVPIQFTDLSLYNPDTWQWAVYPSSYSFTGGSSESSQNPVIIFNDYTTYSISLTVTNAYGSDTRIEENFVSVINNVNEPVNETKIMIYPNPATSMVNINIVSGKYKSMIMEISDSNGKVIGSEKLELVNGNCNSNFDVSKFSRGTYTFSFQTNEQKSYPVKVVIK
ncbi:MAG: T9SS type A sorting domain-containing protein [Bacteroidia bacterium]|nr:T9SS type A sorting domain-containing protein [Bacteroidia bacterium]